MNTSLEYGAFYTGGVVGGLRIVSARGSDMQPVTDNVGCRIAGRRIRVPS
jgi:hypothetical protein